MFPQDKWKCDTCLGHNDLNFSKCSSCEAARPGHEATTAAMTEQEQHNECTNDERVESLPRRSRILSQRYAQKNCTHLKNASNKAPPTILDNDRNLIPAMFGKFIVPNVTINKDRSDENRITSLVLSAEPNHSSQQSVQLRVHTVQDDSMYEEKASVTKWSYTYANNRSSNPSINDRSC